MEIFNVVVDKIKLYNKYQYSFVQVFSFYIIYLLIIWYHQECQDHKKTNKDYINTVIEYNKKTNNILNLAFNVPRKVDTLVIRVSSDSLEHK